MDISKGKDMKTILKILLWLWQCPQNLLGLLFIMCLAPSKIVHRYDFLTVRQSRRMRGGISLGFYVFIQEGVSLFTIWHEQGHYRQSLLLGPLYLIVIGVPSILWAALHRYVAPCKSYYWFYTERWADRLGGIKR